MSTRSFVILAIVTLAVVASAWWINSRRAPETEVVKPLLFKDLGSRINDVAKLEVKTKNQTTTIARKDGNWNIADRGGYPASFEKVKKTVLDVSQLRVLETKTANQDHYVRLGVAEPTAEGSDSKRLTLSNEAGTALATLLVGNDRTRADGSSAGSAFYARKPDEAQALLVEGHLNLSAEPNDWLDKLVVNLDATRVKEISIQHAGQKPIRITKADKDARDFALAELPGNLKLKSATALNTLATGLEQVNFDDVVPAQEFSFPAGRTITEFRTFDGLIATVTLAKVDNKTRAAFKFAADPSVKPAAATPTPTPAGAAPTPAPTPPPVSTTEEAGTLNAKLGNWVYTLPDYKANLLIKPLSDLTTGDVEPAKQPADTKSSKKKESKGKPAKQAE
jgi:hypothetical protein